MFTKLFWRDAIERVLATMAQSALALTAVDLSNVSAVQFKAYVVGVAVAGLLALIKAVAALKTTDGNSASLTVANVKSK